MIPAFGNDYPPPGTPKRRYPRIVRRLIAKDGGTGSPEVICALLCWMKQVNWLGNRMACDYLLTLGEKVIPYATQVLEGDDDEWKHNVIAAVLSEWPPEYVSRMASLLRGLAAQNNDESVNLAAARVLIEKGLLASDEAHEIVSKLEEWVPEFDWDMEAMKAFMSAQANQAEKQEGEKGADEGESSKKISG